jgi:ferredoxin
MTAGRPTVAGKAPGKFYVNELCIGCTLCHETAPGHFRTNNEEGVDFVFRQPETPHEERLCREAMEACPIDAIQDDGLESGHSQGGNV